MSKNVSILADYFGKSLLNEVRGISFEVREWATIIQNKVEAEMKLYWDSYNERARNQSYMFNYRGWSSFGGYHDDFYGSTYQPPTKHITEKDLAIMDQQEIDDTIDAISVFYKLPFEDVFDLSPAEIVNKYNQIKYHQIPNNQPEPPKEDPKTETPDKPEVTRPKQVIINGKDYPEAYEKFKVDKWVIGDSQPTEYNHRDSGYQDDGTYTVFINCDFDRISMYILIHEIKHAYQDWQRISKKRPPIRQSKELQQFYNQDFEDFLLSHRAGYDLRSLDSVIAAYYISSSPEITAYLEGSYDDLKGSEAQSPQGAGKLRDAAVHMVNFKASQVERQTTPATLQKRWKKINKDYNIPLFRKFKNVFDFLKYTERLFNKKGKYIVKKVDKLKTL